MATRDSIIVLPNKHLRGGSRKVGLVDAEILKVIDDMKTATLDWEDTREHELGVALAAIQIDKPYRIVIIREDFDDKNNRNFLAFINPEITKLEGEMSEDFEGCLSIKDVYGKVPRYNRVRVKALNEAGEVVRLKAEGFLARVFQHEIDHTKGIVFIDHIKDKPEAFYKINKEGKLDALDYEKDIRSNKSLW